MIRFDCHAHVYEKVTAVAGARYTPKSPAPLDVWLSNLRSHGLQGGVIVQVSFLGNDNSELCAALSKLDLSRFAGVAVVDISVSEDELDHLVRCGVRGVRWNLVRGVSLPDLSSSRVRAHLAQLRARNLHLELHLESPRVAVALPKLAETGLRLVIDHFGLPSEPDPDDDPWLNCLESLEDRRQIFVKLSAPYRSAFDLAGHATRIQSLLPADQLVWGSDWPHTQHEPQVDYAKSVDAGLSCSGLDDASACRTLYGIAPGGVAMVRK